MATLCLGCRRPFASVAAHYASCRKTAQCRLCGAFVPLHLLARHIACHAGRISDYEKPKRAESTPPVAKHACPTCKKTFVRRKFRDKHVKACSASSVPPAAAPAIEIIDVDPELAVVQP